MDEIGGILDGIVATGQTIFVPELNRAINQYDLIYMNMYGSYYNLSKPITSSLTTSRACTQFVAWGDRTRGDAQIKGGTIAGRNMDQEIDIRRITIAHVIIFAIDKTGNDKRYAHIMWPGNMYSSGCTH
jgi:hypothetical protein